MSDIHEWRGASATERITEVRIYDAAGGDDELIVAAIREDGSVEMFPDEDAE